MRQLTIPEINKLASCKNVRKIAVENFLMTMGDNYRHAELNLWNDTASYKWNSKTYDAILSGMRLAKKSLKER